MRTEVATEPRFDPTRPKRLWLSKGLAKKKKKKPCNIAKRHGAIDTSWGELGPARYRRQEGAGR